MKIKILGTGCAKCKALHTTTEKAIAELGLDATLVKEQDIMKILEYKVLKLPALVMDEEVMSSGVNLSLEEVKRILTK